jgi:hypothetical protein
MSLPTFSDLFSNLRQSVESDIGRELTDAEFRYFVAEFNDRMDSASESIFESMVDNSEDWLDE